jgi:hypothetical protein
MFTHDLPTPGTRHVGESYRLVTRNGVLGWENETDMPHVWHHVLIYLASLELYP